MQLDSATHTFSWLWFGVFAAIYTAWVFSGEFSRNGPRIFSAGNSRSLPWILLTHAGFLCIVLAIYWIAVVLEPSMPHWMFGTARHHSTWYEYAIIAVLIVLGLFERIWLFVGSVMSGDASGDAPGD